MFFQYFAGLTSIGTCVKIDLLVCSSCVSLMTVRKSLIKFISLSPFDWSLIALFVDFNFEHFVCLLQWIKISKSKYSVLPETTITKKILKNFFKREICSIFEFYPWEISVKYFDRTSSCVFISISLNNWSHVVFPSWYIDSLKKGFVIIERLFRIMNTVPRLRSRFKLIRLPRMHTHVFPDQNYRVFEAVPVQNSLGHGLI